MPAVQTARADGYALNGFAKGRVIDNGAATVAPGGGFASGDIDTTGYQYLTIMARIGNATTPAAAAADVNISVIGYEDDGVTTFPAGNLNGINSDFSLRTPTLTAPYAYMALRFNLNGLDRVKVLVLNNNATTALQGALAIYFLGRS